MKVISNNKIYARRGDSHVLRVRWQDQNGEPILLGENDKVCLTVKENMYATEYKIRKIGEISNAEIGLVDFIFTPADTKDLDYFEYVYDIQVTRSTGQIKTIVPNSDEKELPLFIITGEATHEYE